MSPHHRDSEDSTARATSIGTQTCRREAHVRRRTINACRRCKQRKVKCSGEAPCLNCLNRDQSCIFDEAERRLVISEKHLRDLERRATVDYNQPRPRNSQTASLTRTGQHEEQCDQPFQATRVLGDPSLGRSHNFGPHRDVSLLEPAARICSPPDTALEPKGQKAYHRPLSTWSFSQDVRQMLKTGSSERVGRTQADVEVTYNISLQGHEGSFDSSTLTLPPKDHIIHLAQVADFYLNSNHYFFNHAAFIEQLNRAEPHSLQATSELWNVERLLIIALGRLFLERGATSAGPPGIREFLQGLKGLPSNIVLDRNPVMAVETLCLLAIYAQAADMHSISYLYTGQASRIARSCRLDRGYDLQTYLPSVRQSHAQRLWWTVCVLDQRHSATIGVCPDNLISEQNGSLPIISSDNSPNGDPTCGIRLNLLVANSLTRVTKVLSKQVNGSAMSPSFVDEIMVELAAMRHLGQEIHKTQQPCYDQSLLSISRPAASLHLLYCHCVIFATKPFLVYLIKSRFDQGNPCASAGKFPEHTFSILRTCVNAASLSLNIISGLNEQNLLETFMFFNLEITFMAALSLVLANIVIPNITDSSFVDVAKVVLQDMSHRGNLPATFLKGELDDICRLSSHLDSSSRRSSDPSISRETIRMIRDGTVLNDAILDVIATRPTDNSRHDQQTLQATAPDTSIENRWAWPESPESPTLTQNSSWRPSLASTSNSLPRSNEVYFGDFGASETPFTFDMVDLEWLDSVQ